MMKCNKAVCYAMLMGIAGSLPSAAGAAVSLDAQLGAGEFEFRYGSGGTGTLSTWFSGPFGVRSAGGIGADGSVGVADLGLETTVLGAGSTLMQIEYQLHNLSASESFSLGMIARVDPNGGDPFLDFDIPKVNFPDVLDSAEPVAYAVDDFFGNLDAKIGGGNLDNSDHCGGACDVLYALEWDLGALAPGDSIAIRVGLSDDGASLSQRNLVAQLDDFGVATDPSLTFSGSVSAVPIPAPLVLLGSGLAGLLGFARRKSQ